MAPDLAETRRLLDQELLFLCIRWSGWKRQFCTDDRTVREAEASMAGRGQLSGGEEVDQLRRLRVKPWERPRVQEMVAATERASHIRGLPRRRGACQGPAQPTLRPPRLAHGSARVHDPTTPAPNPAFSLPDRQPSAEGNADSASLTPIARLFDTPGTDR